MSLLKSEITGAVNTLVLYAKKTQLAIEEGWEEQDCMLTPLHVRDVSSKLTEAVKVIKAAQKEFAKFEGVAEARKISVGV
jgi:hypothetical protein